MLNAGASLHKALDGVDTLTQRQQTLNLAEAGAGLGTVGTTCHSKQSSVQA